MSQIILDHPIILQREITTDSVSVINYLDDPNQLIVIANLLMAQPIGLPQITEPLTLWQGQAYIDIGNWTTQDAEARIIEILNTQP
jgi:hypothetical protein